MRQVSKGEYQTFISEYPRKLDRHSNTIVEPPMIGYSDGGKLVAKYVSTREPHDEQWWIEDASREGG